LGNTEREITVAHTYAVDQSAIPPTFHYAALGHVHRYQRLEGAPTDAFYTGSLYQLDFGEAEQDKFFNFVVLEDNSARVEKVKVPLLRKLKKLTISGGEELKTIAGLGKNTYLWVEVKTDSSKRFLELKTKLERLLGERLLKITARYPEKRAGYLFKSKKAAFGGDLRNPIETYRLYLQSQGRRLDEKTEKVLKELLAQSED
jgi:exonuclease SbcD